MISALDTLVIPTWANGPDGSGNGGWSAGLLAQRVTNATEGVAVNLRVPPPIGRELQVARVAKARGMSEAEVTRLVEANTDGPDLGILGDPGVNVLMLNLALDKACPVATVPVPATMPGK